MHILLSGRGKEKHSQRLEAEVHPSNNKANHYHIVEQRIHPDLNSLAEELLASQRHEHDSNKTPTRNGPPEAVSESDFMGLEPSTRRRYPRSEKFRQHNREPHHDPFWFTDETVCASWTNRGVYTIQKEQEQIDAGGIPSSPFLSVKVKPKYQEPPDQAMELSSILRRATFGRRPDSAKLDANVITRSSSRSASQSSLGQARSISHSQGISDDQPETPGSHAHSFHTSTSRLRETPPDPAGESLPSPHTFGIPTPPQAERNMKSIEADSYFSFREVPPPLPPLDHPAFLEATNTLGFSSNLSQHSKAARHSHSLPLLTHARGYSRSTAFRRDAVTRPRSRSVIEENKTSYKKTPAEHHLRSESQSSVGSSRRSSAEFSAKQATSLAGGCWEVDVSKAMIRMALVQGGGPGGSRTLAQGTNTTSLSGKARGDNFGARLGLGSPFFLQDILAHNLSGGQPNATGNRARHTKLGSNNTGRVATRGSRDEIVMPHGESAMTSAAGPRITTRSKEALRSKTSSPKATRPRHGGRTSSTPSPARTSSPAPPRVDTTSAVGYNQGTSSLLAPPTLAVIGPTPEASPDSPTRRPHHKSTPTMPTRSALSAPSTPPVIEKSYSSGSAKRKAEEAGVGGDKTPPKDTKEPRTTFAPDPRTHRASGASSLGHAPSSFNRSKRVRLTNVSDGRPGSSRTNTLPTPEDSPPNAKTTGSWSSRGSHGVMSGSSHGVAPSASHGSQTQQADRAPSRRSLSQASIPLSALVSPHAPSISHSGTFHMRDPRKPPPIQSTPWSLSFPSYVQEGESRWALTGWVERGGSPLHAWLFFIGFTIFPMWWIAALCVPIPRTRRLGATDAEKGVILDDPQVEHDAQSWRTRCRVMAGVSLITYVPFIVLVAIFAP